MSFNTSFSMYLRQLPFYDLELKEFLKATGAWVHSSSSTLARSNDLFQNIIENPNRAADQLQQNPYDNYIESKYYNIKQPGISFDKAKN